MTTNKDDFTDEQLFAIGDEVMAEDHAAAIRADDGTTTLPPGSAGEPMVVRSLRLPVSVHERLVALAERHHVPASTLMRQWIETELTAYEDDRPISRADALRALQMLRPAS